MPNYENGKIYCIVSDTHDLCYVGSTTLKLMHRLHRHRSAYKQHCKQNYRYCTSFDLIKLGDARIDLLETYPCASKAELLAREALWIKRMNGKLVNRCALKKYV